MNWNAGAILANMLAVRWQEPQPLLGLHRPALLPHRAEGVETCRARPRDGTSACCRMTYTGSPRSRVSIGR
jgi:hypothetical protein